MYLGGATVSPLKIRCVRILKTESMDFLDDGELEVAKCFLDVLPGNQRRVPEMTSTEQEDWSGYTRWLTQFVRIRVWGPRRPRRVFSFGYQQGRASFFKQTRPSRNPERDTLNSLKSTWYLYSRIVFTSTTSPAPPSLHPRNTNRLTPIRTWVMYHSSVRTSDRSTNAG